MIVMISDGGHHSDGHHREEGSLQHGASQTHPQLQVQGEAGKEVGSQPNACVCVCVCVCVRACVHACVCVCSWAQFLACARCRTRVAWKVFMLRVESVHLQRSVKRVAEARNCGLYETVGIL